MIVEKVRNTTTPESSVQFEVTIRLWGDDLERADSDRELGDAVRKAVNGIAQYPMVGFYDRKPRGK